MNTAIAGSMLEVNIRTLMTSLGYASMGITEALDHIATHGTATDCPMIETDDQAGVNALVVRHTGHLEHESALDWPSVYDEHVYELTEAEAPAPTEPEPFEPAPSDRGWWASEMARLDAEDREFNVAHAGVVDELVHDDGRVTDHDVARSGAVG